MTTRVLVVDDEAEVRNAIRRGHQLSTRRTRDLISEGALEIA